MLCFIDTETTSLDPVRCAPLEVACILTDDELKVITHYHAVVYAPIAAQAVAVGKAIAEGGESGAWAADFKDWARRLKIDPVVLEMHLKNGLWAESVRGLALATVDAELADFITTRAGEHARIPLAGSSVWFDREVLRHHFPNAFAALHYRTVDVSTVMELAKRFWPALKDGMPSKRALHRAMPDLQDSLELCRYYARALGPTATPEIAGEPLSGAV